MAAAWPPRQCKVIQGRKSHSARVDGSGHDVLIMPAGCTRLPFSWENNDDNLALIEKFTDASGAVPGAFMTTST